MNNPIKVHLTGGDQIGWALDQDMATTRSALEKLDGLVELVDLADADVVHSVWEEPLLRLSPDQLAGKRIICHVCNDVFKTYANAFMLTAAERIGLFVAISRRAERDLQSIGLKTAYIPYTIDTSHFTPHGDKTRIEYLRNTYSIPNDKYIVGNFMRDSLGSNLSQPKEQKAAEVFVEILSALHEKGLPVHVLLAGPRRHWVRTRLTERGVPFSFVGEIIDGDDNDVNILSQSAMGELYHLIDVNLVTSRWEGGPRCVLEGAASRTKVVSSAVGLADDVLNSESIYHSLDQAIDILSSDIQSGALNQSIEDQYARIMSDFIPESNVPRFHALYNSIETISPLSIAQIPTSKKPLSFARRVKRAIKARTHGNPATALRIGLWHEFHKPPYGGGNQFMMALKGALKRIGVHVVSNSTSSLVDIHICNSAWFDVARLEKIARRAKPRIIHRVDGPIALYRGSTWEEDNQIYTLNREWASATVYQSAWCFQKMLHLNFKPIRPVIIHNAVDSAYFNRLNRLPYHPGDKLRLISTAWSDNPKKGGPFYKEFEEKLDWERFEYTFVGRTKETFERATHYPAQASAELGQMLRQHHVYLMASQSEACSNALIEALACGLPVLYLDDGGNGELTGFGGLPFSDMQSALKSLEVIADNYSRFQQAIYVSTIESIAERYLDLAQKVMDET
jgi:glycosyltransferase involved in cell wall biosynthesis